MPILIEKTGREAKNGRLYRLIGLDYKVRAKTMLGFKNWPKALEHCYLPEYPRGRDGVCDLLKVI